MALCCRRTYAASKRDKGKAVFAGATWSNLGAMVSQAGRVSPRDPLLGTWRAWATASLAALGSLFVLSLAIYAPIPGLRDRHAHRSRTPSRLGSPQPATSNESKTAERKEPPRPKPPSAKNRRP